LARLILDTNQQRKARLFHEMNRVSQHCEAEAMIFSRM